MDLDYYNRSYDEVIENLDDELEQKMRFVRQQCVSDFINRFTQRQQEWEATFRELLEKSREDDIKSAQEASSIQELANLINNSKNIPTLTSQTIFLNKTSNQNLRKENPSIKSDNLIKPTITTIDEVPEEQKKSEHQKLQSSDISNTDPRFSNSTCIKEFIRIQQILQQNRQLFDDLVTNPSNKPFKNEINLFIRTQINAISNSDIEHLENKIKMLSSLLSGQGVSFQDKFIDTKKHPQGRLFAIDLTAQTFVNVGVKLVNSVPAIAKSMGTVINGIVQNNMSIFGEVIIGHLQEQCPYLVPMHTNMEDFAKENNQEVRYKIACGYSYDPKSQTLETEEKYLIRMRSMTLIYACFLIENNIGLAWTWLASFLSLKPQPVISATILQAFLQEASKKLSSTYKRQYKKLLLFIKEDYVRMIEQVTPKTTDRQSLIKLKNLLSDEKNLIAEPTITSIFGAVKY